MEAEIDLFTSYILVAIFYLGVRLFVKQKLIVENWYES